MFDIADEAESVEKLHELHARTLQEIDGMKSQLKEASSSEARDRIQKQIERFESRLDQIAALMEKMKEAKAQGGCLFRLPVSSS